MAYTDPHSKEQISPRILDALDSMQNALRQHDISHCQGCFDHLTSAMDKIGDNPEDEGWHLSEWLRFVRMKRVTNGPGVCQCKIPAWSGLSAGQTSTGFGVF